MSKIEKKAKKEANTHEAHNLIRRLSRTTEEVAVATDDNDQAYSTMEMVAKSEKAKHVKRRNAQTNDPVMSDEELQQLFDKYLNSAEEESDVVTYNDVHQQILDAEKRAGGHTIPKTDVEKNIDEAEKYVDAMTEKANSLTGEDSGDMTDHLGEGIQQTEQLNAFDASVLTEELEHIDGETKVIDIRDTAETDAPDVPTDTAMMKAFGLDPKTEEFARDESLLATSEVKTVTEEPAIQNAEEEPKETPEEPIAKKNVDFEYEDSSQNKEIFSNFKSKYNFTKIRLGLAAAIALLLGIMENIPAASNVLGGNVNFIAVDGVLTIIAAFLVLDSLISALKNAACFEFDCNSVTFFTLLFSLAATGVTLFTVSAYDTVYLYNFPFAICVFLNVMNGFVILRRDIYSFKVVSSSKQKQMLVRASATNERVPEKVEFADYLGEDGTVCAVKKANFVSSFFAHKDEKAHSKVLLKIFLPECLIFSILFFIVSYFVLENTLAISLSVSYSSFLMSAPFSIFIAHSYPLYLASRRAYTYRSAIIGDKTQENYESAAVMAFRDEDAFPAERTKVKSFRLYADRKIENVMYYIASIYSKLGGPLATVFKQATLRSEISSDIEILEVAEDGVSAMIDGKNIVIGRPAYMEAQYFGTTNDEGDEYYEGFSNKRILYLACEQVVVAKFYIQYTTTPDFLSMVKHLADAGVAVSIRTADPCIDDGILYDNKMNSEDQLVKVVRGVLPGEKTSSISAKSGGAVTVGSMKDLVKTFLLCNKIEAVKKTNFVLKTIASILGIAVMVLVLFTGNAPMMRSIFPAIYQLFWLLPIYCVSKIYI